MFVLCLIQAIYRVDYSQFPWSSLKSYRCHHLINHHSSSLLKRNNNEQQLGRLKQDDSKNCNQCVSYAEVRLMRYCFLWVLMSDKLLVCMCSASVHTTTFICKFQTWCGKWLCQQKLKFIFDSPHPPRLAPPLLWLTSGHWTCRLIPSVSRMVGLGDE